MKNTNDRDDDETVSDGTTVNISVKSKELWSKVIYKN